MSAFIFFCISGLSCFSNSALYEPEESDSVVLPNISSAFDETDEVGADILLNISSVAMAYERERAVSVPSLRAGSTSVQRIERVYSQTVSRKKKSLSIEL